MQSISTLLKKSKVPDDDAAAASDDDKDHRLLWLRRPKARTTCPLKCHIIFANFQREIQKFFQKPPQTLLVQQRV